MASPAAQLSRLDMESPALTCNARSKRLTPPITPATTGAGVTGIIYPSPVESSPAGMTSAARPGPPRRVSRPGSSSESKNFVEIAIPPQLDDFEALDDLWDALRQEKELKMNKEKAKVKSLEEFKPRDVINTNPIPQSPSPRPGSSSKISNPKRTPSRVSSPHITPSVRTVERRTLLEEVVSNQEQDSFFQIPSAAKTAKKEKSILSFHSSPTKNCMVAIFDFRGIGRDDIRVTYRKNHILVSWEKWEIEDWAEEDCLCRRTVERVYHKVIPLAEGTKFRDIYGAMKGEDLLLRYPLVGINGSRSQES